jgi:hypothetical protein
MRHYIAITTFQSTIAVLAIEERFLYSGQILVREHANFGLVTSTAMWASGARDVIIINTGTLCHFWVGLGLVIIIIIITAYYLLFETHIFWVYEGQNTRRVFRYCSGKKLPPHTGVEPSTSRIIIKYTTHSTTTPCLAFAFIPFTKCYLFFQNK